MNEIASPPPPLNLHALRGAVGDVVGAAGCWGQLVWIWRIMGALDGLIAVLWAIVHRLRAGDVLVGGGCPAGAGLDRRLMVAGTGPVRRRPVVRVRAVAVRRVLTEAEASVGRVQGFSPGNRGRFDCGLDGISPVRRRLFSELGCGASRNCVPIVPV